MMTRAKYRLMVGAVVILAVINLATGLTIVIQRTKSEGDISVTDPGPAAFENESLRYSGRYFRDQLGLSKSQMMKFAEFNSIFRQQARDINYSLNRNRLRMLDEMSATRSDVLRLNILSDSIGLLHADLKKLTYNYYFDLKNICDEKQQEKLKQMFMGVFDAAIHPRQYGYGRGGPGGRGRGRLFNN